MSSGTNETSADAGSSDASADAVSVDASADAASIDATSDAESIDASTDPGSIDASADAESSDASADAGAIDAAADGPPASCALVEAGALPAPGFCLTACYVPGAPEMSAHDHKCCDGGVLPSGPCLIGDAAVPAIEAANDALGGCCGWWVEALVDGPDPAIADKCCYTVVSVVTGRALVVACVVRLARVAKRSDWRA